MTDRYGQTDPGPETVRLPRCWRCARTLNCVLLTVPYVVDCPKCKARNSRGVSQQQLAAVVATTPAAVERPSTLAV